jgi:hypothetical protein
MPALVRGKGRKLPVAPGLPKAFAGGKRVRKAPPACLRGFASLREASGTRYGAGAAASLERTLAWPALLTAVTA